MEFNVKAKKMDKENKAWEMAEFCKLFQKLSIEAQNRIIAGYEVQARCPTCGKKKNDK